MLVRIEIPDSWLDAQDAPKRPRPAGEPAIVEKLLEPINRQQGDDLPVSAFKATRTAPSSSASRPSRSAQ